MSRTQALPLGILISFLLAAPCAVAQTPQDATLQVTKHGNRFVLSVPASRLTMTIPQGHFVQKAIEDSAEHSPRHFYLEDKKQGIVASGWFEPSSSYSNFGKIWNDEKESWRTTTHPMPENEAMFKSGGWEGVAYDIPAPGQGVANSSIRAFWVQAGTWIDLRLSITAKSGSAQLRGKLMALLKSIQVKQRS